MFKTTFAVYLLYPLILLFNGLKAHENIVILHINQEKNPRAENAVRAAIDYVHDNPNYDLKLDYQYVDVNLTNEMLLVKSVCNAYGGLLNANKPVHLILETSLNEKTLLLIKNFSKTIGIPLVNVNLVEIKMYDATTAVQTLIPHSLLTIHLVKFMEQQIIYKPVFIMDEVYDSVVPEFYLAMMRAATVKFDFNIQSKVSELIDRGYVHFIFLGQSDGAKWLLDHIVENHKSKEYLKWYIFTFEEDLISDYKYPNVMFANPVIPPSSKKSKYSSLLKSVSNNGWKFSIMDVFYFEISLNAFIAINKLNQDFPLTKHLTYLSCTDEYNKNLLPKNPLPFQQYFEKYKSKELWLNAHLKFSLIIDIQFTQFCEKDGKREEVCTLGKWTMIAPPLDAPRLPREIKLPKLNISALLQEPMVHENYTAPNNFSGFYIDLMDALAEKYNLTYDITVCPANGTHWNGCINELIHQKIDILLGSIPITTIADSAIDFTIPIHNFKGFKMLAKKLKSDTDAFRYIRVLDVKVWFIFIGTYLLASILLWSFEYWSPLSSRNNREANNGERQFTFKECLWFCITSLTPQGGGEIPRTFSGKMSAIIWCMVGFIMLSVYTANLATFMTISKMYSRINTIHDLFNQHDLIYGPHINSSVHKYFWNMKLIEDLLYEKWKNMSLNDYDSVYEKAQWAVWSNPLSDNYNRFFKHYGDSMPTSLEEAVKRVKKSKSGYVGYIYIGETYDVDFLELTDCDLISIGKEFAKAPHAIAVQQKSPLKKLLNKFISEIQKNRQYRKMMDKWWKMNPIIKTCPTELVGIKIENVAGLFILLFAGIGAACAVLTVEYYVCRPTRTRPQN